VIAAKDTRIEDELQRVRDALVDDDAYIRAAEKVAAIRGWRRSKDPIETRDRWRNQLCRLLGSERHCSLRDYAAVVSELGYSPIDWSRFTGGQAA
jgi:hypothetical protein